MRKRSVSVSIVAVLAAILGLASCQKNRMESVPVLSVGINRSLKSAPVVMADVHGLFQKNGISVDIKIENSAVSLFDGLHEGFYDLVCVPEYQAAVHAFADTDFRIIAVLNRNQTRSLVYNGRKVAGIADLERKSIGLARNSSAEYTLYRALLVNGVDERTVSTVYYTPEELPGALANGEVDGVIVWEPFTTDALKLAGLAARTENVHFGRDMYWLLVTRLDISATRSDDLVRLLSSLEEAIGLVNKKKSETVGQIASALSLSPDSLILEWEAYTFNLELPQSLLVSMEQEALWYQGRYFPEIELPDFLDVIDVEPLSAIRPRHVTIAVDGGSRVP